ncbi:MAG: helix-turn-helix domain-containing protein [Polaromonas sp.]|uniref:helix-turn-helix domain-containing protein n=1 Tax=Polaromonas sp. TaxID=1869339 RepID=UPI0024898D18|nr:helix-turn-helix domain-containing protein [Polaromonas sp.]MDI1238649.1 helix-turn-helix domain-containing protein [Polaromonas sp.]
MNIATILKSEISRVSRKEVRTELQALKKSSAAYRSDIAALKRRVADLERLVAKLGKGSPKRGPVVTPGEAGSVVRFSAKGLATQRKRLGLSAAEAGMLLGCSDQSVYKWEQGTTRPRASQMPAIAALRKMGKKEAAAKLAPPQE